MENLALAPGPRGQETCGCCHVTFLEAWGCLSFGDSWLFDYTTLTKFLFTKLLSHTVGTAIIG